MVLKYKRYIQHCGLIKRYLILIIHSYKLKSIKMDDNQAQTFKSVKIMLKQTQHTSYFEKYRRWKDLLQRTDGQHKLDVLTIFLDYFPFNYQQWAEYIELAGPQKYLIALKKNPKSYQLWMKYLDHVRQTPVYRQPLKYRKQIERAILQVGADSRTGHIYIEYYNMLNENTRYEYFKKIFTRALSNLQQIYQLFEQWFDSKTQQQLTAIAAKQTKGRFTVASHELKQFLTKQIKQTYDKTLIYRQRRHQLQSKIKVWYFNGNQKQIEEDKHVWRELINLDRATSTVQNTSYCYERMLMAQMHDVELWEEVFHYLQNQTNKYTKVLNIFKYNKQFFLRFDTDLYFYWCDLEERQNPTEARKMYQELQKHTSRPQVTIRHIQFEIRQKKWDNAKELFDSLIKQTPETIEQTELLCYVLVEYANYAIKYYKDYEYPKILFQSYFDYLPYNHYLFSNYLSFMRNFEYKEGYYDELMTIIIEGLKKAKKVLNQQDFDKKVVKMIKHHLRTVLSSIYLIKLSQRKMMEFDRT